MKTRTRIFIASSSEGLKVANAICDLLGKNRNVDPKVWNKGTFELSKTYIESLEKELNRSDFAVLALTPDDVSVSRKKTSMAPRDNVLFELGLFMGRLGRERCYLVHDSQHGLKLPTDLMGVKPASYRRRKPEELQEALDSACALIMESVNRLGARSKPEAHNMLEREKLRVFCTRVAGAWWERIITKGSVELSFFQITADEFGGTVSMEGDHFDQGGKLIGTWKSVTVGIQEMQRTIVYSWEGWHPVTHVGEPFKGFGEMEFKGSVDTFTRGRGRFVDIHLKDLESTQWKSTELVRITRKRDINTMTEDSLRKKGSLVRLMLQKW